MSIARKMAIKIKEKAITIEYLLEQYRDYSRKINQYSSQIDFSDGSSLRLGVGFNQLYVREYLGVEWYKVDLEDILCGLETLQIIKKNEATRTRYLLIELILLMIFIMLYIS